MTGEHSGDRWKHDGVRVIPGNQLDPNVPSTPGMDRKAAINFARAGAKKLWAGTVTIKPDAKTGAHHHGHLESIIYLKLSAHKQNLDVLTAKTLDSA